MKRLLEELEKNMELKARNLELDPDPAGTPKEDSKAAAECGTGMTQEAVHGDE